MTGKNPRSDATKDRAESSTFASSLLGFLRVNRKKYASMTAFAKATGLSRHTIMQICDGRLTNITARTRSAIFATTGLSEFSPPSTNKTDAPSTEPSETHQPSPIGDLQRVKAAAEGILRSVTRLEGAACSDIGPLVTAIKSGNPEQHVERIRQVLSALDQELSFFKDEGRESAREVLRARIDPKDVGYIIALLRALYSKEAFDNWVLASGYSVR